MAWTTPKTWAVNEVLSAANFNTHIRDNLNYLLERAYAQATINSTYTTTSGSWADIDATNLSLTVNHQGAAGRALVVFMGSLYVSSSAQRVAVRLLVNGVDYAGGATYGMVNSSGNLDVPFTFVWPMYGIGAGAVTYKLQWYTTGGATGQIRCANTVTKFFVFEV